MVIITEEDLADLRLPTKRTVDVLEFVSLSEVDPIYSNKSYSSETRAASSRTPCSATPCGTARWSPW
jgi:non-homologous end joining protein Ku